MTPKEYKTKVEETLLFLEINIYQMIKEDIDIANYLDALFNERMFKKISDQLDNIPEINEEEFFEEIIERLNHLYAVYDELDNS